MTASYCTAQPSTDRSFWFGIQLRWAVIHFTTPKFCTQKEFSWVTFFVLYHTSNCWSCCGITKHLLVGFQRKCSETTLFAQWPLLSHLLSVFSGLRVLSVREGTISGTWIWHFKSPDGKKVASGFPLQLLPRLVALILPFEVHMVHQLAQRKAGSLA